MKKKSSVLVVLIVLFGLLVSGVSVRAADYPHGIEITRLQDSIFGKVVMGVGTIKIIWEIGKIIFEQLEKNQKLNNLYKKNFEEMASLYKHKSLYDEKEFIKSEFPEKIEERINAIIDQWYKVAGWPRFEIFSTQKSKIFVLQNIQDFFDFQQDEKFKNFNSTVYEICTKKIKELEKKINELEKEKSYESNKVMDDALDNYKKQFGISTFTLKNMSAGEVDRKIDEVKESIDQLANDMIAARKGTPDKETEVKLKALVSILTHLYYKQSKKKEMFVEAEIARIGESERKSKQELTERGEEFKKILESEVSQGVTPEAAAEKVAAEAAAKTRKDLEQQYPAMKFFSKEQAPIARYQQLEKEAQQQKQEQLEAAKHQRKKRVEMLEREWKERPEKEALQWREQLEKEPERKQKEERRLVKQKEHEKLARVAQKSSEERELREESIAKKKWLKTQSQITKEEQEKQWKKVWKETLKRKKVKEEEHWKTVTLQLEAKQKRAEEEAKQKRAEEEAKRQPILSKMRSLWNSWWYGTK